MQARQLLRGLSKFPTFTLVVLLTLGVGIGANAAVFSVIRGVLLKPLPFPASDGLVVVDHTAPGVNVASAGAAPFLYFTYRDLGRTLQHVGLWNIETVSVTGLAEPEEVETLYLTHDVLRALQLQPQSGRLFTQADDSPGTEETVLLTAGYWRQRFGGDPAAVGRRMLIDGRPMTIIGVLGDSFRFLDQHPAVVLPLRLDPVRVLLGNFSYRALARLRPGVSVDEANADCARLIPVAIGRYPPFPGFTAKMFSEARLGPAVRPLKADLVGNISSMLWILMGTIGAVLLIACANVANLLLVRAEGRQQELAIRAALGAGRGRIARELLAESVVLALLGGVVGLALAYGGVRLLLRLGPANLPRLEEVAVDGSVLLFTLAVSLGAGVLFGTIPALRFARPGVMAALRAGGRTATDGRDRQRVKHALVVVQVALALVLLVSSGLMIRTIMALRNVDPGFAAPAQLQTLRLSIPPSQVKEPEQVIRTYQAIADAIASIPGVASLAWTSAVPMTGEGWTDPVFAEDRVYAEAEIPPLRRFTFVTPGLLRTMGQRLLAGRDLAWTDLYEKRLVVLVSDSLARELWRNPEAAVGKRLRPHTRSPWFDVVGVVADQRFDGLNRPAPAMVYWPALMGRFADQETFVRRSLALVIRSPRTGTHGFMDAVSRAVWSVNANLPIAGVRTMEEIASGSMARTSFTLVMLTIAGAMALLLGVAGIYGVISYSVAQRTREIGIRIALGARQAEVTGMFVRRGVRVAAIGIACGLAAAIGLTRLLASLLFEVSPADPLTYVAVSAGLVLAAAAASYIPALRVTSVDPVSALRAE